MLRKFAVGVCVMGGILFTSSVFAQSDVLDQEFNPIRVAASYLIPSSGGRNNPLDNTFRFSIGVQIPR